MATQPRKDAPRLARPAARYWKGKAPKGVDATTHSDSEDEDEAQEEDLVTADIPLGGDDDDEDDDEEDDGGNRKAPGGQKAVRSMNVALRDVKVEDGGKVIVGGKLESGRTAMEESGSEEESSDEEEAGLAKVEEESSGEYESSSEEEDKKPKLMFRPVFVPKRGRDTVLQQEADAQHSEEAIAKRAAQEEQRKKDSHDLVAESIKRELAEKETAEIMPDIDDADGEDPAAEFEAWRLRELGRIKRDKEAQVQRELEKEEIERRRAMPEEQRMKEDLERAQKLRDEKPKGQQKFLQKYYHKGAFHQDAEILKKRDYTEATESTIDISALPKVMQVKNFGKRSQTKYTHLADQDTSNPRAAGGAAGSNVQCFLCGGPHLKRDCPQNQDGAEGGTGANNAGPATGTRKWGIGSRAPREGEQNGGSSSWKDRDGDRKFDRSKDDWRRRDSPPPRPRSPRRDYDRSRRREDDRRARSRSRSPPPRKNRDDGERRRDDARYRRPSRSRSRERDRHRDEKRRRVD